MKKQLAALSVLLLIICSCDKDNDFNPTPQYVDLGLSVKWATFNVGASQPQESGDYYAWGELSTKRSYYWSTYQYNIGEYDEEKLSSLTKYCPKAQFGYDGFTDTLAILELSDDIAHIKWGGNWRTPTAQEFMELLDSCKWEWEKMNGIKGFKITSNVTGFKDQSIFLPAVGYISGLKKFNDNPTINYWTGSLFNKKPYYSYCLSYHYESDETVYIGCSGRYLGRPIRPVWQ